MVVPGKIVGIFVDRENELNALKRDVVSLKRGAARNYALIGPRRIGKTALLQKLISEIDERKIIPVYLDVLPLTSWTKLCDKLMELMTDGYIARTPKKISVERVMNWLKGTTKEIIDRISKVEIEIGAGAGQYIKLRTSLKEDTIDEIDLVKHTLSAFEEFGVKKEVYFLVCLDEFQRVAKFPFVEEVLAAMRSVMQFQKRVMYVFSGSSITTMRKLFTVQTSPFWKQVESLEIKPLSKDAVAEFLKLTGSPFGDREVNELLMWTRGIPDYLHKTIAGLETVSSKEIERGFRTVVRRESPLFSALFEELPKTQQKVLITIARGRSQYKEIEREVGRGAGKILDDMISAQLVVREKVGKYGIWDPGLELYLKQLLGGFLLVCKNPECRKIFSSGIVMDRKSFETATLLGNIHKCPFCGKAEKYDKPDYILSE